MDSKRGSGEYKGPETSRLNKPREGGLTRECPSSASVGCVSRRSRLDLSSHTSEDSHRYIASDP